MCRRKLQTNNCVFQIIQSPGLLAIIVLLVLKTGKCYPERLMSNKEESKCAKDGKEILRAVMQANTLCSDVLPLSDPQSVPQKS